MKHEPLKDKEDIRLICYNEKVLSCYKGLCGNCSSNIKSNIIISYSKRNILLAVEWLKEEMDKSMIYSQSLFWKSKVDKAFEDVIKK